MGQGDVGGNGSVQWTFVHHNKAGGTRPFRCVATGNPVDDEVRAGGNRAASTDPISFADIGTRKGLEAGKFKATLTTYTFNAAGVITGSSTAVYHVPAVDRTGGKNPVTSANPIEIKVEW